ncbi:MAG: IPT/TIG domain-containing protein [Candidatus Acidiferrales bacterium]
MASFKEAGLKRSWWGALALVTGIAVVLGGCGGSNAPTNNATPIITNLFPSNITAGSQGFTLAITGSGMISSAKGVTFAYWNGSPRSTTFDLTTNQLLVTIPASDVAVAGSPQITLWNPPAGGGMSQVAATFTIEPVAVNAPTITGLSPTSATAGGPDFMLTVTGTNFAAGDVIAWNGVPLTTSISGDTAIATIPAPDIAAVGTGSVTVSTPGLIVAAPSVAFPITGADNPSPKASSISPSSVAAGGPDFEAVISGSGFNVNSAGEWNGVPLASSYLSGSKLVVLIPATDTASGGAAQITVTNPAPGGGTSSQVTFTVNAAN